MPYYAPSFFQPYLGSPPGPYYPPLSEVGARLYRYNPAHGQWTPLTASVVTYQVACQRIAMVAAADPNALLYAELMVNSGAGWQKNKTQVLGIFLAKDGAPFCVAEAYNFQVGATPYLSPAALFGPVWGLPGDASPHFLPPSVWTPPPPLADTFTIEAWQGGGWSYISLGSFGPVFPWQNFCAVIAALPSKYASSSLRVTLKKGSQTTVLPSSTAAALSQWQICGGE